MKLSVQVGLVFVLAFIGLGSAIKCYSCIDYTGSCTQTSNCAAQEDGCLTLKERHGKIYRQCVRYSDCTFTTLGSMFSKVSNFVHDCCNHDLCNGASLSATRTSVIALILSLALFWCCIV